MSRTIPLPPRGWQRAFGRTLAGLVLLVAIGCSSGTGAKNSLTGKVTVNGQAVAGNLYFIGADGKESNPVLLALDGTYTWLEPAKGTYKVLVKGMPGMAGAKDSKPLPGMPATGGMAPPPKYATTAGGLTVTITEGNQTKDFELTP